MDEHKLTPLPFFTNYSFLLTFCSIQLVSCSLFLIYVSPTSVQQVAIAQQQSSLESSQAMIKGLLSEASHTLESGNSNKTVENLLMVQRLIAQTNDNSTSIQSSMLLIRETVGAILSGRSDIAKANINLINEQLIKQAPSNETSKTITGPLEKPIAPIPSNESKVPSNETSKTITGPLEKPIAPIPSNESKVPSNKTSKTITGPLEKPIAPIPSNESKVPSNKTSKTINNGTTMGFQTYQNNIFGIKIRYPDSWSVRSYPYNNANNNTVVGFYSPSKTASQLGNISGVSGHFIPYLDIFAFDSRNMSLDKIINGRIKRIQNTSDFVLDSKPFTLKGNHSAYMLVYSAITGGDEFFKKMQVYTIFGNKVYLITFTAQEALFSNYLPTVRKMVDSFEVDL
jgi:PsbP-like protein